ncbi:MAG TPA: tRNA glutamyl-Q(34) synthetase GluQRS [Gammaproteobacteria bacterium]|nr:tRNA glutamyl-Q(34) synthetase GluQRS [Gammaproteobacteria bacterium]
MTDASYCGRFAPSPTGPLHFGSLVAAVGSFLDARSRDGEWLLRMEDLDPPREMPGAADDILRTLEAFGFCWDGEVTYQSQRQATYRGVLHRLEQKGATYPCGCTRREIRNHAGPDQPHAVYPGTCRDGLPPGRSARSVRLRVPERVISFEDRVQGAVSEYIPQQSGDFILLRADGLFAYQLAVVVDDADQGITDIVRGADLLDSTCQQIVLQQALGYPTPHYLHLPVVVNEHGKKLSKQSHARAVSADHAVATLCTALRALGQPVADEAIDCNLADFWKLAEAMWRAERIPKTRTITEH